MGISPLIAMGFAAQDAAPLNTKPQTVVMCVSIPLS